VEFVVEEAGAALGMAAQGGIGPQRSVGTGHAIVVEAPCDGARRDAGGEVAEDAADHFGLIRVDGPFTPDRLARGVEALHHVVTIAEPTTGLAGLDAAAQAPMGLGGKIHEEQGVHGALEADTEFGNLAPGQHQVEFAAAGVGQQGPDAGPQDHAGAGDGGVVVASGGGPALPLHVFPANAELVLDWGGPLVVGGTAGVEDNTDHRNHSVVNPARLWAGGCRRRRRSLPHP
jgi:hypothetical protein